MENNKQEEKKASEIAQEKVEEGFEQLDINLEENKPTPDIESLCMNCEEQGITKFMFMNIPFYKEIIVSSFSCEHCGYKNSEVQFAAKLEDYGCRYEVNVINNVAFDRTIVKSDYATIKIPEAGLEIPPESQKGQIKTIEGYFLKTIEGLQQMQPLRKIQDPDGYKKIDDYCETLRQFKDGEKFPFTFIVEDPSGCSFVQNPSAPTADQYCKKTQWIRSAAEYSAMGYSVDEANIQSSKDIETLEEKPKEEIKGVFGDAQNKVSQSKEEQEALLKKVKKNNVKSNTAVIAAGGVDFSKSVENQGQLDGIEEGDLVSKFPTPCYACQKEGSVQMCTSSIPFFKEIIIMAFVCEFCGYRNSEIKEGGGIGEKAKKITFSVQEPADLNRDIFKSNTAKFTIKELDFDMAAGSLGSMYTTVEGLLAKLIEELEANNPFGQGDSKSDGKFIDFINKIKQFREGNQPFTLILDDAADNCFIYNPYQHEGKDDPKIQIEIYERTEEQNDDLGVTGMNVDNYTQE